VSDFSIVMMSPQILSEGSLVS